MLVLDAVNTNAVTVHGGEFIGTSVPASSTSVLLLMQRVLWSPICVAVHGELMNTGVPEATSMQVSRATVKTALETGASEIPRPCGVIDLTMDE